VSGSTDEKENVSPYAEHGTQISPEIRNQVGALPHRSFGERDLFLQRTISASSQKLCSPLNKRRAILFSVGSCCFMMPILSLNFQPAPVFSEAFLQVFDYPV